MTHHIDFSRVVRFANIDRWDPPPFVDEASFNCPTTTLEEIAHVRLGVQVPRRGDSRQGSPRPYLRAINVRRGHLDLGDMKIMYISESQASQILLKPGDLLFVEGSGSITEVGRVAVWADEVPDAIHQNSIIRARLTAQAKADIDPDFVVTWFNSRAGNSYVRQQATTTSGLYHIGAAKLARAPIPIPDLDQQRDIVVAFSEALRQADSLSIDASRQESEAWRNFERSLVHDDLPSRADSTTSITHFSLLDRWDAGVVTADLKSRFAVRRMDQLSDVQLGVQLQRGRTGGIEVPYLRVANVQAGFLDLSDVKTMNASQGAVDRLSLKERDILFLEANSYEEVGRCAVWNGEIPTCIHQNHIIRARLSSAELLPEYLVAWFNSGAGRAHVRSKARTNSGSLYTIPVSVIASAPVPVPTVEEQANIVARLKDDLAVAAAAQVTASELREQAEAQLLSALTNNCEAPV